MSSQTKPKKTKSPAESAAHCLGHWIRVEALAILIERVASPKEIAAELGETLQLVTYHMGILDDENAIELVREETRGAVSESFYRATMRPELTHDEWLQLSPKHKQELAIISIRNLFAENLSSVESGRMTSDAEMYYWWKAMPLDAQGREEMRREQDEHAARILEIEAKANARMVGKEGQPRPAPTVIAILGFDRGRTRPVQDTLP